jgi:Tol biopolymer transport system component
VALSPDGPILFELVAHGTSTLNLFSPITGRTVQAGPRAYPTSDAAVSPDRKWLAFTLRSSGAQQIWLRELGGRRHIRLTGGNCNSFSPTWEWDSQSILFASDCSRGLGLPALYRAPLQSVLH